MKTQCVIPGGCSDIGGPCPSCEPVDFLTSEPKKEQEEERRYDTGNERYPREEDDEDNEEGA